MNRKILLAIGLVVTLCLGSADLYGVINGGTIHQFTPAPYENAEWVYFSNGIKFSTQNGEPVLPKSLRVEKSDYYIVHCKGSVYPEYVHRIEAIGAKVYSYIPNNSFLIKMSEITKNEVEHIEFIDWIGIYQPAYKISGQDDFKTLQGVRKVTILLYPDAQFDGVMDFLETIGAKITDTAESKWDKLIIAEVDLSSVPEIAKIEEISWIEPWHKTELHNDNVQWILQTASSGNRRVWDMGITGDGELVSTCDTGIRTSHYAFRNTSTGWITTWGDYPSHRKIIAYQPANSSGPGYADFGDEAINSYHGTHTAGTACGNDDIMGSPSGRDGLGIDSRIYFLDGGGSNGAVYHYSNLNDLFILPYNGNAAGSVKMISNSWGSSVNGAYTTSCAQVDQFMWDHNDFLAFFSNGNSGPGSGTVGSPAAAKNCVSVGGCRNGSNYQLIYGSSSRGPTQDGRYKPTIIAPAQTVYSPYGAGDSGYWGLQGTSMASPGAAGAGTLVRQYFSDGFYPTGAANPTDSLAPSAALLKAMLVNCADPSITGYTNVPNNNIGWGRIDLDSVLYFSGDTKNLAIVDEETGLSTGQFVEYTYSVNSSSVPIRIALIWTDYPATAGVGIKLINDLHLTVTDPGANEYKGNVYSAGQSVTGGSYDILNVEECVRINSPATGSWTIRVDGNNCPYGPQPFALVVTGNLGTTAQPDVVYVSNIIDDSAGNNNGRVDPGETVYITVTLRNDGSVDATNATGTLRTSSSDITLIDSVASYGTISANGGTAQGTFQFSASVSIPQGTIVPMTVYFEANGGAYTTNCNFQIIVGLPRYDYVNHDIGNCVLTVTKHGSIGYLGVNSQGSGFIYPGSGSNQLYHSSMALANATNYVMDRFYINAGATPNNTDWLCTTNPDGRCWIDSITPAVSDQESWAMFSDSGCISPKGIIVTQHGYAWSAAGYDDFVITRFEVKNAGASAVSNIYTGVIADLDMGDAYNNRGGTDATRRLAYEWDPAIPNVYVGVKLLAPYTATNVSVLQNDIFVYNGATNIWHDTTHYKFLNGTLSFPSGTTNEDWSVVVSAESYTLNPGETQEVAFAFVGGSSLANLQENADSAQSIYDQYFAVLENTTPTVSEYNIYAPYPNPFDNKTCITFSLSKPEHVKIMVYNTAGQLIKNILDEKCSAGLNKIYWYGKDNNGAKLPNGVYFYSIETEKNHTTKKLIILH